MVRLLFIITLIGYAAWSTSLIFWQTQAVSGELQKQLVLERRVEELVRTRYGAIGNNYTCHLRAK